jgi:hypothetical protein
MVVETINVDVATGEAVETINVDVATGEVVK